MLVSNHPEDATEIVRRVSNGEGLLSNGGASISNLVSGDAVARYIMMATIKDKDARPGPERAFVLVLRQPHQLHAHARPERRRDHQGVHPGAAPGAGRHVPTCIAGFPYPVARAATNVLLRSLGTSLVIEEMFRGTPVIYMDYTDYDEIAHHSGPERAESLDALDGVDRSCARSQGAPKTPPAVPLRRPLRPRPEPRLDVPAALRRDPPGRRRGADGRPGRRSAPRPSASRTGASSTRSSEASARKGATGGDAGRVRQRMHDGAVETARRRW